MNAQKVFDTYRKKEGLATFLLSKGQLVMLEDTNLPFLFKTKEERKASWANVEVIPMPTFLEPKVEDEATRRFRRLIEIDEKRKKDESLARLKERFTKEKAAKPPKPALGAHVVIKLKAGAKRAPGTKAAARFDEMVAYVRANPKATVADVLANTNYRSDDYKWDLAKGNIVADLADTKPVAAPPVEEKKPAKVAAAKKAKAKKAVKRRKK